MSDTDFGNLTRDLCIRFWGKPASETAKDLRWGSGGSRSYSIEKRSWFDHEANVGGGTLDLVMRECVTDKAGALAWLEREGLKQRDDSAATNGPGRQEHHAPDNQPPEQESLPVDAPQGIKKPVKGYRYTDADGNPLYEVIRFHFQLPDGSWQIDPKTGNPKKTFGQRRPDGRGGYIWNLEGIGHTIFRHQQVEIGIAEGRTIHLVEGEKDVETLEAWGLIATTNSGGASHWSDKHAALFRGADVVIIADNDDAGRAGAEKRALSLRGIAKRVRVLDLSAHLPDFPAKWDVTDWRDQMGGSSAKLAEMTDALPQWRPARPASKFKALAVRDAIKFAANHDWLVDDLIEAKGTFAFAGNSQSGKTFQVIELAFCVATGRKYWGRDVKQGLVVYQVGEGEDGFMKRLAGWMQDHGIDASTDVMIEVLPQKINLFSGDDDTNNLIAEAKALEAYHGIPLRMIVIDTYNKATRGSNEISGQDVGKINERLERIMTECNCAVGVVDHLSAGGRVRGHGSKTGDITNMIIVEKDEKKVDRNGRPIRRMRLDKNKDGENGSTIPFVLRQVVVGYREDGKAITTCVVEAPDGNDEELEKSGRLPLNQSLILQTIRDVIGRDGSEAPHSVKDVPKGRHVVGWKAVMAELRRKWVYKAPESEPEQRERELQRIVADAGKRLQVNGYIDRDNTSGIVWWTGKTDRPLFKARTPEPERPQEQPGAGIPDEIKRELASGEPPF